MVRSFTLNIDGGRHKEATNIEHRLANRLPQQSAAKPDKSPFSCAARVRYAARNPPCHTATQQIAARIAAITTSGCRPPGIQLWRTAEVSYDLTTIEPNYSAFKGGIIPSNPGCHPAIGGVMGNHDREYGEL
jgi:hypothetical protein